MRNQYAPYSNSYRDKPLPSRACKWGGSGPLERIRAQLAKKLKIKGTKIPASAHGEFKIDGWNVVVKRSVATPGRWKSSAHRVFVRVDGELIPAGRVRQALCLDDRLDAKRRVHARVRREFKRKFDRMSPAEQVAYDAKKAGRSKKEIDAILEQKQLAARRRRRR